MARSLKILLLGALVSLSISALPAASAPAFAAELDKKGKSDAKEAMRFYKEGNYEDAARLFVRLSLAYPDMLVFVRNLGACYYYMRRHEPALSNLRDYLHRKTDIAADDRAEVAGWVGEMERMRDQAAAAAVAPAPTPPAAAPPPAVAPTPPAGAPVPVPPVPPVPGLGAAPGPAVAPESSAAHEPGAAPESSAAPAPPAAPAPSGGVAPVPVPFPPGAAPSGGAPEAAPAAPPSIGAESAFPPQYPPQGQYPPQPGYPPQGQYPPQPGYAPGPYGAQPGYPPQGGYAPQPQPQPYPPPSGSGYPPGYAPQPGYAPGGPPVGVTAPAAPPPQSSGTGRKVAAWLLGIAGAGTVGLGGYFTYKAYSNAKDLEKKYDSVKEDKRKTAVLASGVCYGIGGAALLTAIILGATGGSSGQVALAPAVGPGMAGATLGGSF